MASGDPNLYEFELFFKSLYDAKTPVSRSKIQMITDLAVKAQKFYKHVVMHIETFIRKSSPKHKLPGIYVIDSIIRMSLKNYGKDRDVFARRFAKNLATTFSSAAKCADEDRFKVFRCFKLWKESDFFDDDVMEPIIQSISAVESFEDGLVHKDKEEDVSQPGLIIASPSPTKESKPEVVKKSSKDRAQKSSPPATNSPPGKEKVKFDKRLLDFDYSDEEDGERSGRRKKRAKEEEDDFFVVGKNGKPEFSVDKIMSGMRKLRGGSGTPSSSLNESMEKNTSMRTPEAMVVTPVDESRVPVEMEIDQPAPVPPPAPVVVTPVVEKAVAPPQTIPLPPPQSSAVTLKSCTIWIGHLAKSLSEWDLRSQMQKYGTVKSLDLISSRGCAYISYGRRKEAEQARNAVRVLEKIFGDKIKLSWGPGRGIKDGYKSWDWDSHRGVCKIPVGKLPLNCKPLIEGSELVEDSVPDLMKARFSDKPPERDEEEEREEPSSEEFVPAPPPAPQLPVLSLPMANPSSWQNAARSGFNPKVNPWTMMAQPSAMPGTQPPASVGVPLLRPPALPVLSLNNLAPAVSISSALPPAFQQLLAAAATSQANGGPRFSNATNFAPAQNGMPIQSLSSISSVITAVPTNITQQGRNGPMLPWSDNGSLDEDFHMPDLPKNNVKVLTPIAPSIGNALSNGPPRSALPQSPGRLQPHLNGPPPRLPMLNLRPPNFSPAAPQSLARPPGAPDLVGRVPGAPDLFSSMKSNAIEIAARLAVAQNMANTQGTGQDGMPSHQPPNLQLRPQSEVTRGPLPGLNRLPPPSPISPMRPPQLLSSEQQLRLQFTPPRFIRPPDNFQQNSDASIAPPPGMWLQRPRFPGDAGPRLDPNFRPRFDRPPMFNGLGGTPPRRPFFERPRGGPFDGMRPRPGMFFPRPG